MPIKAKHRAHRRSRVRKYLWVAGTAGAFGTTLSAMSEGEWGQNASAFAPIADSLGYQASSYPELESIRLNPTAPTRLANNLFLDAGLDAMSPSLMPGQYYSAFPLFWGENFGSNLKADGEGSGWGNIGLTWNFTKHQHLALTYRSPMDVDYSGRFTMDPMEAGAGAISSRFNSAIGLPTVIGIGYGIALTEAISLEADFELLGYAHNKSADLNAGYDPALFTPAGKSAGTPQNWHNSFVSGVGADWKFADHWVLRAGYQYFENPVHSSAFSPSIPEANQHVVTLGVAWKGNRSSLELAYAMDFYYDLHIANDQQPSFNGTYGFSGHLLSLAYKFTF